MCKSWTHSMSNYIRREIINKKDNSCTRFNKNENFFPLRRCDSYSGCLYKFSSGELWNLPTKCFIPFVGEQFRQSKRVFPSR